MVENKPDVTIGKGKIGFIIAIVSSLTLPPFSAAETHMCNLKGLWRKSSLM
jgi:hypothetical protein